MLCLIKSFNRPWALDRCLHSLPNVKSISKTVVIDDGTESKYLNIIRDKYPHVSIITDPKNNGKVEYLRKANLESVALWNGLDPNKLWAQHVRGHSYFFLHEDDVYTPRQWDIKPIIHEMQVNNIEYLDLSGKFGRSVRVDKVTKSLTYMDMVANTKDWSWFAAAFCIYSTRLFSHLYGQGLGGKLQDGNLLVRRAKEFYKNNPDACGASIKGEAKVMIGDSIPSRRGHQGPPKIQQMNDALNSSWASGDFSWEKYYPDLESTDEILRVFRDHGIDDNTINIYTKWRRNRFSQYKFPYGLDGKVRWDDT